MEVEARSEGGESPSFLREGPAEVVAYQKEKASSIADKGADASSPPAPALFERSIVDAAIAQLVVNLPRLHRPKDFSPIDGSNGKPTTA